MANALTGIKVAFLTAQEGIERVELTEPWQAVVDAGGEPVLIAPEVGAVQTYDHLDKSEAFESTVSAGDARAADFAGLVLPGGVANPDQLRMHEPAVALVRAFADAGRPIFVICHGSWTLVEADVVASRQITSWPSVQTDLRNAGADWVDDEVVECRNGPFPLISSRNPDDLPAFCAALTRILSTTTAVRQG